MTALQDFLDNTYDTAEYPATGAEVDAAVDTHDADAAAHPGTYAPLIDPNQLAVGEANMPRHGVAASQVTLSSGTLRLGFFTAQKTETITQVRSGVGGTGAGATPTLIRCGIYSIDGAGAGTLIASTPNDTALFVNTSTNYTKALSAGFAKVAGTRYAIGWIVVTGATAPAINGAVPGGGGPEAAIAPRMAGSWAGQTDLPASFTDANLGVLSSVAPYVAMLP